jgi:hypothetical protein
MNVRRLSLSFELVALRAAARHNENVASLRPKRSNILDYLDTVRLQEKKDLPFGIRDMRLTGRGHGETDLRHTSEGRTQPLDGMKHHGAKPRLSRTRCGQQNKAMSTVGVIRNGGTYLSHS